MVSGVIAQVSQAIYVVGSTTPCPVCNDVVFSSAY